MALVHERLYRSADFSTIDFADYLEELGKQLHQNYALAPQAVLLTFDSERISFDINRAISCGLILNELISNALKRAFPNERKGEVHIYLRKSQSDGLVLGVSDTGSVCPISQRFSQPAHLACY
jgi:two-component sensor histidine kinase